MAEVQVFKVLVCGKSKARDCFFSLVTKGHRPIQSCNNKIVLKHVLVNNSGTNTQVRLQLTDVPSESGITKQTKDLCLGVNGCIIVSQQSDDSLVSEALNWITDIKKFVKCVDQGDVIPTIMVIDVLNQEDVELNSLKSSGYKSFHFASFKNETHQMTVALESLSLSMILYNENQIVQKQVQPQQDKFVQPNLLRRLSFAFRNEQAPLRSVSIKQEFPSPLSLETDYIDQMGEQAKEIVNLHNQVKKYKSQVVQQQQQIEELTQKCEIQQQLISSMSKMGQESGVNEQEMQMQIRQLTDDNVALKQLLELKTKTNE